MTKYHGTLVENLCRFAEQGLVPDRKTGYVWLTTSYEYGARWAESRAGRWVGHEHTRLPYTVLRVRAQVYTLPDPNLPDPRSVVTTEEIAPQDLDVVIGDVWSKRPRWQPLLDWARKHCRTKSPAQLDAEIAKALAGQPRGSS